MDLMEFYVEHLGIDGFLEAYAPCRSIFHKSCTEKEAQPQFRIVHISTCDIKVNYGYASR